MCSFHVLTAKNNLRKIFNRVVKSVLVLSTVTFWGKLILWSFVFFLSGKLNERNYASWQKKLSEVDKISSYVSRKLFLSLEKPKSRQMRFYRVLPAEKFLRKLLGIVVKSVLVLSKLTFWGKLVLWRFVFFSSFWEIERKFYAFWQKKLSQAVKNSFYVSRWSFFFVRRT